MEGEKTCLRANLEKSSKSDLFILENWILGILSCECTYQNIFLASFTGDNCVLLFNVKKRSKPFILPFDVSYSPTQCLVR